MVTELFLILLTICTAFVDRNERTAALLFLSIAHIFYFVGVGLIGDNNLLILRLAMLAEMVTVVMLFCVKGSINSRIITPLMAISVLAIPMHFYGTTLISNEYSLQPYNQLVNVYYTAILALFLTMSGWSVSFYKWLTDKGWSGGGISQPVNIRHKHDSKPRIL